MGATADQNDSSSLEGARPETWNDIKTKFEAQKVELEVKELQKVFWRRKEFFGFQGSLLVGLMGVIGANLVTYCTSREHMEAELQVQLIIDAIAALDNEEIEIRTDSARRLVRLDEGSAFKRLDAAYQRSLSDDRKSPILRSTPYLRVGAIEAIGTVGIPLKVSAVQRDTFLLAALINDPSPLVRFKAAQALANFSPSGNAIEREYESEKQRIYRELTIESRHGSAMVRLPSARVVIGSDIGDLWERPSHERQVESFWIDVLPVSIEQWNGVMGDEAETALEKHADDSRRRAFMKLRLDPSSAAIPAVGMTQAQASRYCKKTGGRELPTEYQLEAAARGQSGWRFPWGDSEKNIISHLAKELKAREGASNGVVPPHLLLNLSRVQSIDISPFGVQGLAITVKHWTNSEWTARHERSVTGSWLQKVCSATCVIKGGAAVDAPIFSKTERFLGTRRQPLGKADFDDNVGFRCVENISPSVVQR